MEKRLATHWSRSQSGSYSSNALNPPKGSLPLRAFLSAANAGANTQAAATKRNISSWAVGGRTRTRTRTHLRNHARALSYHIRPKHPSPPPPTPTPPHPGPTDTNTNSPAPQTNRVPGVGWGEHARAIAQETAAARRTRRNSARACGSRQHSTAAATAAPGGSSLRY